MSAVPSTALLERRGASRNAWIERQRARPLVARLLRYSTVSVIATSVSLSVLALLVGVLDFPAVWANVVATAAGTIPSFELNRRWVWGRRGGRSLAGEVAPFWMLSFAGLVLSTLAVHLAAGWASGEHLARAARTLVIMAANLGSFGSVWVAQYLVLDRVLFRNRPYPVERSAQCAAVRHVDPRASS